MEKVEESSAKDEVNNDRTAKQRTKFILEEERVLNYSFTWLLGGVDNVMRDATERNGVR